jgi:hypothetical protein
MKIKVEAVCCGMKMMMHKSKPLKEGKHTKYRDYIYYNYRCCKCGNGAYLTERRIKRN